MGIEEINKKDLLKHKKALHEVFIENDQICFYFQRGFKKEFIDSIFPFEKEAYLVEFGIIKVHFPINIKLPKKEEFQVLCKDKSFGNNIKKKIKALSKLIDLNKFKEDIFNKI